MNIPLSGRAREAVETVRGVADKASAFVKLALAVSVLALCLATAALVRAFRVVNV